MDQKSENLSKQKSEQLKQQSQKINTNESKSIKAARFINKIDSSPSVQSIKAQREQSHSCKRVSKDTRHQLIKKTTDTAGWQSKRALTGIPV